MVTHVVSWFGLAIDLVFFFIVFSSLQLRMRMRFSMCLFDLVVVSLLLWIFLLIRIMTRWCRRFGLVIAFVAVPNSFFSLLLRKLTRL